MVTEVAGEVNWLDGAAVLVTGAGGGIGSATCAAFAARGARVFGFDLDDAAVTRGGVTEQAIRGNVTSAADLEGAVATVGEACGRLDIVIAASGIQAAGSIEDTDEDTWRRVLEVNLTGVWLTCKYATAVMRRQGSGTILCIASTAGLHPRVDLGAYCVSKAGVAMLVQVLGREVAAEGIRVIGVCPTGVETPLLAGMIEGLNAARGGRQGAAKTSAEDAGLMASKPVQRWLSATEVAEALVWFTAPHIPMMTGSNVPLDFASV